jgi:branched-chain amino acid transport system permease protein
MYNEIPNHLIKWCVLMESLSAKKDELLEFLREEWILFLGLTILFMFYLIFPFLISSPTIALQTIINGAVLSTLYSILALGFSLIYGIAKQLKLSLGGYYVVAAYCMYFLVATKKIDPGLNLGSIDAIFLTFLFLLPLIISIGVIIFLSTIYKAKEIVILIIAITIAIIGALLLQAELIEAFYIGLTVLILGLSAWYLELPKRGVLIGTFALGISVPVLLFLNLPIVYLALLALSVIFTAVLAMASDRYVLDKVRHSHVNVMIVTFAIALLLQSIIQLVYFPTRGGGLEPFGPEDRALAGIISKSHVLKIYGVIIPNIKLIALILSIIVILLLYAFIWFTKMGMALRAVAQDEEAAALAGIDIRKTTAIVSGIGMGLVGFAAVLTSPFFNPLTWGWNPYMGWGVLIIAIAVVTLGGMGSLPGSIVAAFIIGYTEVIISSMPDFAQLSVVIPFIIVLLFMILKPEGLLGIRKEME